MKSILFITFILMMFFLYQLIKNKKKERKEKIIDSEYEDLDNKKKN